MNPGAYGDLRQTSFFFRDALRPRSWDYIIGLCMMLFISFAVYTHVSNYTDPLSSLIPMQIVYFLTLGLVGMQRFIRGGWSNILAPDIVFIVLYTAVHLGYVGLFSIGAIEFSREVFFFPSAVPRTMMIINLGLISFLLGIEATAPGRGAWNRSMPLQIPPRSWEMAGMVFILLGIFAHIVGLLQIGIGTIIYYGYAAIQDLDRYNTGNFLTQILLDYSLILIALGIVVYCIASSLHYGKLFRSKFVLGMVVFIFALMILEGDRGPLVKFGLPMLIIRHYLVRPIKVRYVLLIGITTMVLFAGLGIARSVALNPSKMYEEYNYNKEYGYGRWYHTFAELGGSFNTLNITAEVVPKSEPYWRGASWRDAAIHIVPFAQGIGYRIGIGRQSPSTWVTETFWGEDRAGRAFTVTGEGYLNFGYPGVFIELFAIGAFLRWLTVRFCLQPSAVRGLVMFGCIAPVVLVIRNHSNLLFAPVAQVFVGSWLLGKLLGRADRA